MQNQQRKKSKLQRGWSYPLSSGEAEALFPSVGHWIWSDQPLGGPWREQRLIFALNWKPRSAQAQPGLQIAAVRSSERSDVRDWIRATAAPQAQDWITWIESASPTLLDTGPAKYWSLPLDSLAERTERSRQERGRAR